MGWGDIRGYTKIHRDGEKHWKIVRGLWVTRGSERSLENALFGRKFSERSEGPYTPVCTDIDIRRYAIGNDKSLALAYYETPRAPDKASLQTETAPVPRRRYRDRNGAVIEGPGLIDDGMVAYRVVQGQPVTRTSLLRFIVETAYVSPWDIAMAWYRLEHVNSHVIPEFGRAPVGSVKLTGFRAKIVPAQKLTYVDYIFDMWPEGWDNFLLTQPMVPVVWPIQEHVITDALGEPTGEMRKMLTWLPAYRVKMSGGAPATDASGNMVYESAGAESRSLHDSCTYYDITGQIE